MEKIYERDVAKKNYLNKKPLKYKLIILSIILLLILSGFLIWAYGFKGLLYLEYKNKTEQNYINLVIKEDSKENCMQLEDEMAKKSCLSLNEEKKQYYDFQASTSDKIIKYTDFFVVESLRSNENIIFSVTNEYFVDIRESDDKLLTSIFFIYKPNDGDYLLHDILFKQSHLEKVEEYSK